VSGRILRRRLAAGIAEEAEEIRIRPQHEMRIAALHAPVVGLHRAIEAEEIHILAIGLGKNTVALGIALAANGFRLRSGVGEQNRHVTVRPGPDFLAFLAALGAELRRLALPLGLHALIDRLAVLLRKVDAANAHVDDVDAEWQRVAIRAGRASAP
jgi:hypothetical protein